MRDKDVRAALHADLQGLHSHGDTLIRDELGLCLGATRVDVAVINGSLVGYEIKSDRDRLDRLAEQARLYGNVLDLAVLVAAPRHLDKAAELLPPWWGLTRVVCEPAGLRLQIERPAQDNPAVQPLAVAQLLWRQEAFELLEEHGGTEGLRRATRWQLWRELVERLGVDELRAQVRRTLRARRAWPTA